MQQRLIVSITILLGSVVACQSVPDLSHDSPYYTGFIGSTIILNQTLEIGPGEVSVYVQGGNIMEYKFLDFYQPVCKFEINTMQQRPRRVKPDRFNIVRVVRDEIYVENSHNMLAGLTNVLFFFTTEERNYLTELYLSSETQPDVRMMTCSHWENSLDATHLSVNQMRAAMGSVFTLVTKY